MCVCAGHMHSVGVRDRAPRQRHSLSSVVCSVCHIVGMCVHASLRICVSGVFWSAGGKKKEGGERGGGTLGGVLVVMGAMRFFQTDEIAQGRRAVVNVVVRQIVHDIAL